MNRTSARYTDHVSADQRQAWAAAGHYPGQDLYSLFRGHVQRTPQAPAVLDAEGTVSYGELDQAARRLAAGLVQLGIVPGDVVAVQLPNARLACAVDLAVAAVGAVVLPFPLGRGDRDAVSLLRRSEAVAVITVADHHGYPCAERIRKHADALPMLRAVIVAGDGAAKTPDCVPIEALAAATADEFVPRESDPDAPARILVTSGSEAEPKMVLYSHNALAGGRGAMMAGLHRGSPATMRNLFLVPLASAFGSSGTPVTLATLGGTLVLRPSFDAAGTLRTIAETRPTHLLGVPTMLRMLLDRPEIQDTDLSSLQAAVLGGAALDLDTARRAEELLGCTVVSLYGSADGVSCNSGLALYDGTVGRPDPAVADIRIVDPDGIELPGGATGEVVARGPMSPMSYLNSPELDASLRNPDGWTRTGDLGLIDDRGRLRIVGRRKDVVIRGGLNISPAEVESVLITHPAIRDVACVAVADPLYGERVCACVATSADLSLAEVTAHLAAAGMEPRKFPERLLLLAALPLSAAGKVDRQALRAQAANQGSGTTR
ncbi:class I adenylate-forming enzyme family protein [Streptomyces rubradiris]|uniref:2,3-dihydroxybenzoate-AMP ligase n=1 Tax=Streptomyces rubradiris TaxID=285531 RepID=A0ABQ3R9Z1_STRRR|nr:class I adenylate-forming enzyme family protein [Streptomyces rubradiris]GHH30889.1 2,3-dihydroxybenzoate-AMP ligase [Streptomyces rubradiris]GHI52659.1 2,3-dihydroxybenzoate-AMP ligase [Streptomyces rubradiris]